MDGGRQETAPAPYCLGGAEADPLRSDIIWRFRISLSSLSSNRGRFRGDCRRRGHCFAGAGMAPASLRRATRAQDEIFYFDIS
jgi:hypothetical protein